MLVRRFFYINHIKDIRSINILIYSFQYIREMIYANL